MLSVDVKYYVTKLLSAAALLNTEFLCKCCLNIDQTQCFCQQFNLEIKDAIKLNVELKT